MNGFWWGVVVGGWLTFAFAFLLGTVITATLLHSRYRKRPDVSSPSYPLMRHNRWRWANERHNVDELRSRARDN